MKSNYNKVKASILKYQKGEKYKEYKKEYDKEYRSNNRLYANFRATKSALYSKYSKDIATLKLANYVLKKKNKGIDLSLLLSPTNR